MLTEDELDQLAEETCKLILQELCGRKGIKNELGPFYYALISYDEDDEDDDDLDIAFDILESNTAIIRSALEVAIEKVRKESNDQRTTP